MVPRFRRGSQKGWVPRRGSQKGWVPRRGSQKGWVPRRASQKGWVPRRASQKSWFSRRCLECPVGKYDPLGVCPSSALDLAGRPFLGHGPLLSALAGTPPFDVTVRLRDESGKGLGPLRAR